MAIREPTEEAVLEVIKRALSYVPIDRELLVDDEFLSEPMRNDSALRVLNYIEAEGWLVGKDARKS